MYHFVKMFDSMRDMKVEMFSNDGACENW